jgi:hypothetical protein
MTGPAARCGRSARPTCRPSSPTSPTTPMSSCWRRRRSAGGGGAGASHGGSAGRLRPSQVAAGPGSRVGRLDPEPALADRRHPRHRWRQWGPRQPGSAPAQSDDRRAGDRGGRLGSAIPAQPRRRRLATGCGRGAAHRPAARPAGAARVGGPARPGRPAQPGQPRSSGDRARWGVRDRLQAVSGPPPARRVRKLWHGRYSLVPALRAVSWEADQAARVLPAQAWRWCRSWPSTAPTSPGEKWSARACRSWRPGACQASFAHSRRCWGLSGSPPWPTRPESASALPPDLQHIKLGKATSGLGAVWHLVQANGAFEHPAG